MSESQNPRVLSRLSWLTGRFTTQVPEALEPIMRAIGSKGMDKNRIIHAYNVAEKCHRGQYRKSGEPYITHPVAVATITAELGLDEDTIVGALLHDTVEDTPYTLEDVRKEFGATVELLVDGVTKLDKVEYGEVAAAETVRKMVIAMSKDIRVLLIKLADRLHNARTWKYMPKEKAASKAHETLEIYAPLAHRLGMNSIKWELEDLSFKVMFPEVYAEIESLVQERTPEREEYISKIKTMLEKELRSSHIKCTITGRPKHYYSIYQKMILRGKDFEDIYDLVGVRVLVETIPDCYAVLGVANTMFTPIQGRIKDYIASPKFNLYQSIHTTVIGPGNRSLEIQIRTYDMHKRAEFGVAAHWRYKENPNAKKETGNAAKNSDQVAQLAWLRQLVDWQRETADPAEFLEALSYDISGNQVYVFTPAGEVMELAMGATPVDFAYAVHTEVGHHTVGARVNDKLVTLDHKLESGDIVEIITSKNQDAAPSRGWLDFVATPRARAKIRAWFKRSRREEAVEEGKDKLARAIRKKNQPVQRLMSFETLSQIARELGRKDVRDLYVAIGEGDISSETVVRQLIASQGGQAGAEESMAEAVTPTTITKHRTAGSSDNAVIVDGMEPGDVMIKLAKCCTPLPPDFIVGFITRGSGVSIHRADCPNAIDLMKNPDRFIKVSWANHSDAVYLTQIQVDALDRQGLLSDISRVLLDNSVNLLSGNMTTTNERMSRSNFTFEMADPHHLTRILNDLRRIEGVYDAYRVTNSKPSQHKKVSRL
ncbi:RelA/SpoT family protein [Actinotignum urinale]|uniref:RelA/SpoT family protein n=1 Tax=Actinotignum urinale TaxID=190146 RepID=UPI00280B12D6|nr:bifunctional (p)ppGpp synthetase/guanosine-3',5'-bis(diphosphate) 3'-pyrophosphohydrolase [Actinotignum urinale]MDY5129485.1 bifunctional (p)ppGpp synthetase/guanosine-3',5'-bis(diphosphate) 3'-pyrophosphohydrolase [Actinotignum urinale]